ncbi:MAG: adenine phosphoribosyltransferase, partial [Mangrovicoccus sp.]
MQDIKDLIRTIPDFPQPGIMFRDVTTLFGDAKGMRMAVDRMLTPYSGQPIDY